MFASARVIVFVIGGVCHSEMRDAYEAMHAHGREVRADLVHVLPVVPRLYVARR